ncbi:MAG: peptidoglycan-associated lipoprotein Pal [Desulfarculaceae bacterium]|nr:peptidoglycan-associated lipoprotein Pal [Desulfarculaceae bacterium]
MGKRIGVNLLTALLVAGLFFTVSCAKKTVVSEPEGTQVEKEEATSGETGTKMTEDEMTAAEKAKQRELEEQRLKEQREQEAKKAAKARFVNKKIHFEFDSSVLTAQAREILKEKAGWLENNQGEDVLIEGHCDERGTTEYNLALGERRAKAARDFLINMGIAPDRLSYVSFGEEKPLDPGHNPQAWSKNRRAQFVIK